MIKNIKNAKRIYDSYGTFPLLLRFGSHILNIDENKLFNLFLNYIQFIDGGEAQYIAQENGNIWHSGNEASVDLISNNSSKHFTHPSSFESPNKRFICEIPRCRLIGPGAVGLFKNRIITDTATGNKEFFHRKHLNILGYNSPNLFIRTHLNTKPKCETCSEHRIFPMIPFYNSASPYYPWILEYLPKLRMLEMYEETTGNQAKILLPSNPPEFMTSSLSLLGFDSDRWIEWDGKEKKVESLLFTNHRCMTTIARREFKYEPSYDDITWVRERLRNAVQGTSKDSNKEYADRIYISRQQADRGRKVINYDGLVELLEEYGFKPYIFESLPFEQQVRIASEADIIMGPHGAGLTNMIFADDPEIIELFSENHLRASYYLLANILDFEYQSIVSESNGTNFRVDLESLDKKLSKLD